MKSLVNTAKVRKLKLRIEGNKLLLSSWGHRWREALEGGNEFAASLLLGWFWDAAAYDLEAAENELNELTG